MKIGLGLHFQDTVHTTVYLNHLTAFCGWAKRYEIALAGVRRVKVAQARNLIVQELLKQGCTHWLSIDDDHIIPDNMLDLLVESADAGMVSGLVCKRGYPFELVAFKDVADIGLRPAYFLPDTGVHEVAVCAFGCTLINLKALEGVPTPWFVDTPEHRSDVNFCTKVRDAGLKILVDTRVSIGHMCNPQVITPQLATAWRKQIIEKRASNGNA